MKRIRTTTSCLLTALGLGIVATADARSIEVNTTTCPGVDPLSSVEVGPQQAIGAFRLNGGIRTNPTGGIFDMMTANCYGTLNTAGGIRRVMGYCVWVDKDGDKVTFQFHRGGPAPGHSDFISGTGKFTGIKGGGDYQVTPMPALGSSMNSCIDGAWKIELP